jgi:ABC-type transport system substrate-binding protein
VGRHGAVNLFDAKLSCRAYRPASEFNNNESQLCDRRVEARRARRLALTDPGEAKRLWESIYRDVLDHAPWVPTVTPVWTDFVSQRVGNYQAHPMWAMLAGQIWVR